ncbi:MAG: hypothetical protein ACTHKF_07580 [Candidatus Nitrosocosmicus sp.]
MKYASSTIIFVVITIISLSVSIFISYLSTVNSFFPLKNWLEKRANDIMPLLLSSRQPLPSHNNVVSIIKSDKADIQPIQIYNTSIIPKIRDYYNILSASVNYTNNRLLVFSMDLAGNPNKNERYETSYIWLLYYNDSNSIYYGNKTKNLSLQNKEQIYTLMISNFATDSKFKLKGWYMAIFNNTNGSYTLPFVKLPGMPENKVEVFVPPYLLGSPSFFDYLTCVSVRVNSTFLNKPPDYVMDSLPHDNKFWKEWFSYSR